MGDEISSTTGDNADTSATGSGINQNRNEQRTDPRQFLRNDINFNNPDNEKIYAQLLRMVEESGRDRERLFAAIHAVDMKVDDLPNKVNVLTGRVSSLEKVEVKVNPGGGEVTIKTAPATEDKFHIPLRTAVFIIFLMILASLTLTGWLILRVNN